MSWGEIASYWHEIQTSGGGGGTPGGADTQVQFNDGGAFAGDAGLTYNKATDTLSVGAIDLTTALPLADGGTGADLSAVAKGGLISGTGAGAVGITAVGADGLVLSADAASAGGVKWVAGPAPAAAGADTQILFNDGGALAGDAGMTYDKTGNSISLTGPLVVTPGSDIQAAVLRRNSAAQTQKILLIQTELNAELASVDKAGNADFTGLTLDNPLAVAEGGTGADQSAIALGGLLTGSGAGTIAVKAVGADGTFLKADSGAAGGVTWAAGGGGVTNSAGANVITKSDGTNVVATALSEASAGAIATSAGTALGLTATAPAATTGASQAGVGVSVTASPAVASTDTAGAAAGGAVTITAGAAARNTSGNADGGDIALLPGAAIGTGRPGVIKFVEVGSSAAVSFYNGANGWHWSNGTNSPPRYGMQFTSVSAGVGGRLTLAGGSSSSHIGFSADTYSVAVAAWTPDTFFRRRGAANPAWGAAAASPVSYLHTMAADSRAGTDTNVRGGTARVGPGVGSGTGGSGDFVLQTAPPGSTGTAANTLSDRVVLASKPVTLTESSATPILDYAVASGTVAGGTVWYTIRADDATDFQALRGQLQWAAVNKGGVLTMSISEVGTPTLAASSGTLTNTATITAGTNSITINLNAVCSLTQTTLYAFVSAQLDGTGVATTK